MRFMNPSNSIFHSATNKVTSCYHFFSTGRSRSKDVSYGEIDEDFDMPSYEKKRKTSSDDDEDFKGGFGEICLN